MIAVTLWSCTKGHSWEASTEAANRCPACGAEPMLDATLPGAVTERSAAPETVRPHPDRSFEILEILGKGGMGVVYKARQRGLNRIVALKMIHGEHAGAEDRIRFQIEAEAVAQLEHPHIVQVHEVGERDGSPFLALEYLPGGSLQDRLAKSGMPDPQDAARLIQQLAQGIHYAHQRGIVHRDLKPANILFATDGTPKIADFGLAKRLDALQEHTQIGCIMGTPANMAPEQAMGLTRQIGPATDIYSLGTIFYQLLAGKPPLQGDTIVQTFEMIRLKEPAPIRTLNPKVPGDLETICLKCLQKDPAKRYVTAQELADELGRYLRGEPILSRPVSRSERAWLWMKRRPAMSAALFLGVLLVVSGFSFVVHEWRHAEQERRNARLQQAEDLVFFMSELQAMYSDDIVDRLKSKGIEILPDYKNHPGAIPNWATFVHNLSDRLTAKNKGLMTRLYSDQPFKTRIDKGGGVMDDLEREALRKLRANPGTAIYEFEMYNGEPALRFFSANVMQKTCVDCHNTHKDSPRDDWKIGDVRGVFEVIILQK